MDSLRLREYAEETPETPQLSVDVYIRLSWGFLGFDDTGIVDYQSVLLACATPTIEVSFNEASPESQYPSADDFAKSDTSVLQISTSDRHTKSRQVN
ncbi:hypothetical protein IFR05_000498 [Cadophora sp. M221]|nr:hypothetical protein IFR05_000498 [Cadophora sp. M221]